MDVTVVGVAICLAFDQETGYCEYARIALGSVAPTPVRAKRTEKLMIGQKLEDFPLNLIQKSIRTEVTPISDIRGSADYRFDILSTLTARAIKSLQN